MEVEDGSINPPQRSCAVVSVLEVLALLTLLIQVYKLGKKDDNKKDRR